MATNDEISWNRYRSYLRLLADSQIDSHLHPHIDLSGIVQQTLLEAFAASKNNPTEVTLPFLRRILATNLIDEVRRIQSEKRDFRRKRDLRHDIERSSMQLESLLVDQSPSPSENVIRQERILGLSSVLEKLPTSQREVIILQLWHGWSLAAIGDHLGKTTHAVAGLLKRGLKRLRLEMESLDSSSKSE